MGFSVEWEEVYKSEDHFSVWPWSDVVNLVMRHAQPSSQDEKVLELGCGLGSNIPFLKSLGYSFYSVEGSASAVAAIQQKYSDLAKTVTLGDFTRTLPDGEFDLVLDRGSLTHNSTSSIKRCLEMIDSRLKVGGKMVCVDWFSRVHSEYGCGEATEDPFTERDFSAGQFAGLGAVHFATEEHIRELFSKYKILTLEHSVRERIEPNDGWVLGSYNFAVEKIS